MRAKTSLLGSLAALALPCALLAQEVQSVLVTNFPAVQAVKGQVDVIGAPAARLVSDRQVVTTGRPEDVGSLTEGGLVDGTGFTTAVLSLAVDVKGALAREGRIGVLLVPDEPELLRAVREEGIVALALKVEAQVGPQTTLFFTSDQPVLRLGFPRYRVFYYNSTPRAADVKLWAYLTAQ